MIFLLKTKTSQLLETQEQGKRLEDFPKTNYSKAQLEKFKKALTDFAHQDLGGDITDYKVYVDFSDIFNINTIILIVERNKNIFSDYLQEYLFSISKTKIKKLDKNAVSLLSKYITYEMILDQQSLLLAEIMSLRTKPIKQLVEDFPTLALLCSKLKHNVFSDFWAWFEKDSLDNDRSASERDRVYKKFHGFTTDYSTFFTNTEIGIPYKKLLEMMLANGKKPFKWNSNTFSFYGIDSLEDFLSFFEFDEKLFMSSLHLFDTEIKASENTYTRNFTNKLLKSVSLEQNLTTDKRFVKLCKDQRVSPVFLGKRLISF